MEKVSTTLATLREHLSNERDSQVSMASEVGAQYITDHNDRDAYRELDKSVNRLARAWDKMIGKVDKWIAEAQAIETSCDNFYGD